VDFQNHKQRKHPEEINKNDKVISEAIDFNYINNKEKELLLKKYDIKSLDLIDWALINLEELNAIEKTTFSLIMSWYKNTKSASEANFASWLKRQMQRVMINNVF